ncbi:hypothetical protein [Vibrio sp. 10N.239.312.D08]|uniref:hypothetical protein n=1 Tax=Vibrio sp. 10N.239.312.D08 TaxID=3229978 RepID=UPI00354C65E4
MRLFSNGELVAVFVGSAIVACLNAGTESIPELLFGILMGVVLAHVLKAGYNTLKSSESKSE